MDRVVRYIKLLQASLKKVEKIAKKNNSDTSPQGYEGLHFASFSEVERRDYYIRHAKQSQTL